MEHDTEKSEWSGLAREPASNDGSAAGTRWYGPCSKTSERGNERVSAPPRHRWFRHPDGP